MSQRRDSEPTAIELAFVEAGKRYYAKSRRRQEAAPLWVGKAADLAIEQRERSKQRYRGGKAAQLLTRRSITPRQHEAGQLWIGDFRLATSGGRALDDSPRGGGDAEVWLLAKGLAGSRFAEARDAVGRALAQVVFLVFGLDREPSEIAEAREARHAAENPDEPPRKVSPNAVVEVLRTGLDELADFYSLPR